MGENVGGSSTLVSDVSRGIGFPLLHLERKNADQHLLSLTFRCWGPVDRVCSGCAKKHHHHSANSSSSWHSTCHITYITSSAFANYDIDVSCLQMDEWTGRGQLEMHGIQSWVRDIKCYRVTETSWTRNHSPGHSFKKWIPDKTDCLHTKLLWGKIVGSF